MTISKHTPGPWMACNAGTLWDYFVWSDAADKSVCNIDYSEQSAAEVEANARLIAAAPELLAALQALAEVALYRDGDCTAQLTTARAAIAKATGQEQQQGQDARP